MGGQADEALDDALRRARAGDESGFLELWRELQPRLLRYLRVQCGSGTEDIASETWLQVVRDLPTFIGTADGFRGWLFTIARHRAIDAARAAASRPAVPVADIGVVAGSADRPATVRSAEGDALESISTADAIALVKLLPPDQAEAVALRVIGGLDVAAVAEMLGKSAGAVRVNVHRGLRSLHEMSQQGKLPLESREVV
ncbi:MAG TPA: RNA polymerase sigma factor [Mycobacteriales bacterium]|nr:RNA polymerase sigma factor [Mycobacteriales bacterium]